MHHRYNSHFILSFHPSFRSFKSRSFMQMKSEGQFPVPNIFWLRAQSFCCSEEKQPHMKKTESEWHGVISDAHLSCWTVGWGMCVMVKGLWMFSVVFSSAQMMIIRDLILKCDVIFEQNWCANAVDSLNSNSLHLPYIEMSFHSKHLLQLSHSSWKTWPPPRTMKNWGLPSKNSLARKISKSQKSESVLPSKFLCRILPPLSLTWQQLI